MSGHVRPRGKDTWLITLELGVDPVTGNRKRAYHTFRGPKRKAEAELTRLVAELNRGDYIQPDRTTVGAYLRQWLDDHAKAKVNAKTWQRYEDIVERHLIPGLGAHKLSQLQPQHIQRYYREALEAGRLDGKGGLSARTVNHYHRVLRSALEQAVKWQILPRNVADLVDPPRVTQKEPTAIDERATVRLLSAIQGTSVYLPTLLAVLTGARRGEVLALKWEDVDLQTGRLKIRRSLQELKGGRSALGFKEPKTQRGRRTITLQPMLIQALIREKGRQAQHKLSLGPAYEDHGLICCWEDGRPMVPNQVTQTFKEHVRRLGLDIRFHDLRHSHISHLLKHGETVNVVADRAGHADPGMTLRVYGHVLEGMERAAALRNEEAFRRAMQEAEEGDKGGTQTGTDGP
ncbi:MAG: tyrosine-type recombinase/integrase [Armatimonadota bacterium]